MTLRRGFKSEANWYARSIREELRVHLHAPLCVRKLAEHLGVPLLGLVEFEDDHPQEVNHLRSSLGQKEFSAVTLCIGPQKVVIYNDAHSPKRQTSDIAHELSHIYLLHPHKPPFNDSGSRHYDAEMEEEANWLGPALLISDEAALYIARNGLTVESASEIYCATEEVVRMRLNVSGAYRRVRRVA